MEPTRSDYTTEEIMAGALVDLSHEERMAIALRHGQLNKNGAGCVFWLLLGISVLIGYLWSSWWIGIGYFAACIVLIGIHYGCRSWAIVTMHRRPMWFYINATIVWVSKIVVVIGTLAILILGVV